MIIMEKLDGMMTREHFDIKLLESVTRRNIYNDISNGTASEKDIKNVADVLGCNVSDIDDSVKDPTIDLTAAVQITTIDDKRRESVKIDVVSEVSKMGYSNTSFSEMFDISLSAFNRYAVEKIENSVTSKISRKLSCGLKCSLSYLYGYSTDKGKSEYSVDQKNNSHVVNIKPIGEIVKSGYLSPSNISKKIFLPYETVKKLMSSGGYIPKSSLKKFITLYNLDEKDLVKTTIINTKEDSSQKSIHHDNKVSKHDNHLMDGYNRQKELEDMMKKSAEETSENAYNYKHDLEMKVAKLSAPVDDKISLNQLSAVISILGQRPELVYTFVDLCKLSDEDFSHIHENLKWQIEKCNRSDIN